MDVNIAVIVLGVFIIFFVIYIVRRSAQLRHTINGTTAPKKRRRADRSGSESGGAAYLGSDSGSHRSHNSNNDSRGGDSGHHGHHGHNDGGWGGGDSGGGGDGGGGGGGE